MANFEALGVVTESGKRRMSELLATGKAFKIDRFVIGDQGHDPSDPSLALTPDPGRSGCYCAQESITVSGSCLYEGLIDSYRFANSTCPVYKVVLPKGQATGVISSICLLGTIVYSPIVNDPEVGTRFLFCITNLPYNAKIPQERYEYEIFAQL